MPHVPGHRQASRPSTRLFGDRDRVALDVFSPPDRPEAEPLAAPPTMSPERYMETWSGQGYAPSPPVSQDDSSFMGKMLRALSLSNQQIPMSSSQGTPGTSLGPSAPRALAATSLALDPVGEIPGTRVAQALSFPFPSAQPDPESERMVGRFFRGEMSGPELAGALREAFRERPLQEQVFLGLLADIPFAVLGKAATLKRVTQAAVKALRGTTARGAAQAARGALRGEVVPTAAVQATEEAVPAIITREAAKEAASPIGVLRSGDPVEVKGLTLEKTADPGGPYAPDTTNDFSFAATRADGDAWIVDLQFIPKTRSVDMNIRALGYRAGRLSIKDVRTIRDIVRDLFPDARSVGGMRVTPGHKKALQHVPLSEPPVPRGALRGEVAPTAARVADIHPFQELANAQLGTPEALGTNRVPKVGVGIRQYLSEHIGDIINRMTNNPDSLAVTWARDEVGKKAARGIRSIEHPYGIRKEIDEQIRSNAKGQGISFDQAKRQIDDHGQKYADAHRELPAYNQAHRDAQEAAVAWGEQRYEDALVALKRIEAKTHDEETWRNYILKGYDDVPTPTAAPHGALRGEVARQIPTRRPPVGGGAPGVDAAERLAAGPVADSAALKRGDVYTDYTQQQDRSTRALAHQVPKDTSDHVRRLAAYAPAREELLAYIDEGLEMGGREWYNTERIRDLWIETFGEGEGHRLFEQFIHLVSAASPGSDVQSNIRVGSWASREVGRFGRALGRSRQQALGAGVDERGFDEMLDFLDAVGKGKPLDTPTGYGRGYGPKGLFKTIKSWASGDWDDPAYINNPKVRSFAAALLGSRSAVAIDSHLMRILGMVSDNPTAWLGGPQTIGEDALNLLRARAGSRRVTVTVKGTKKRVGLNHFYNEKKKSFTNKAGEMKTTVDRTFNAKGAVKSGLIDIEDIRNMPGVYGTSPGKDYGAIAGFITDMAAERGITPAQAQASIWLAAGDRTGVSGLSRGTFVDALRMRLFAEARDREVPVVTIIHDWINNRGLLSFLVAFAGGAAAKKAIGTTPSPDTGGGAAREEVMGTAPPAPALGSLTGNGRGPFADSVFA